MLSFLEYLAREQRIGLPDTLTMLAMAGVSLNTPNKEEMNRLVDRDKKLFPQHRPRRHLLGVTRIADVRAIEKGGPGLSPPVK